MEPRLTRARRTRRALAALVGAVALTLPLAPGAAADPGFRTRAAPMLEPAAHGVTVTPLITVGDTLPGGYMFEAIPDGIALDPRGQSTFDIYVNHETSLEPFPATKVDFVNSELSKLTLKRGSGKVLAGEYVIPSSANYQRFCSNFLAGPAQGFDRHILFTNEEAVQIFNRSGVAWPLSAGGSNAENAGVVVAYDVDTGDYRSIYGMGRHNHENSVAVPGFDELAIFSGDDTFVSNPASSQLYLYTAPDTDAVWDDEGQLWAFRADSPAGTTIDDYYDVTPGTTLTGRFIAIDDHAIATGKHADGTEVRAADFGFAPPAAPFSPTYVDGPQWVLDQWSNANGVFRFVRVEDIAYDRNMPNVLYLADSGRGSGAAPNGRIWRMELDPDDPTVVTSLTILFDNDGLGLKALGAIHQPDNLETTADSLLVTEDPSSGNQYAPGSPDSTPARVWQIDLATGDRRVVLAVDQALDPAANLGAWEASGIVDASQYFGAGAFLVDVQAHTIWVGDRVQSPYLPPGALQTREGGQLLLVRIEGA